MSQGNQTQAGNTEQQPPISWVDFLQDHPPGSAVTVSARVERRAGPNWVTFDLINPDLHLHCPEESCNRLMFFSTEDDRVQLSTEKWDFVYLTYMCRNCSKFKRTYSLAVMLLKDLQSCKAYKFGELPPFGPPIPARVLTLIGPEREIFLNGRRCENQGLGIGALTYYRRVVENQWSRLVDEIIKVASSIGASQEALIKLTEVRDEKQFSKAVTQIKSAFPPSLLINGNNPLILLHGPLSQGVHNLSDQECLELATSIRVVLVELAEKVGQALKDEKELKDAVNRLLQTRANKKEK